MKNCLNVGILMLFFSFALICKIDAATITLLDGSIIKGAIIDKNETTVTIEQSNGIKSQIPLKEIEKIEDEKSMRYDPAYAARMSVIPLQSGSFLVDYNAIGISLAVVKTASVIVPLGIILASMGSSNQDAMNQSDSYQPIKDENLKQIAVISLGVWLVATIGDMFYSYNYIKEFNEKNNTVSISENMSFIFTYSLTPLSSYERNGELEKNILVGFCSKF